MVKRRQNSGMMNDENEDLLVNGWTTYNHFQVRDVSCISQENDKPPEALVMIGN